MKLGTQEVEGLCFTYTILCYFKEREREFVVENVSLFMIRLMKSTRAQYFQAVAFMLECDSELVGFLQCSTSWSSVICCAIIWKISKTLFSNYRMGKGLVAEKFVKGTREAFARTDQSKWLCFLWFLSYPQFCSACRSIQNAVRVWALGHDKSLGKLWRKLISQRFLVGMDVYVYVELCSEHRCERSRLLSLLFEWASARRLRKNVRDQ